MDAIDAFTGTVLVWPNRVVPEGWMLCHGQVLAINQLMQLYEVIGTTYGGDGRTTFALPNLCGRIPAGVGQGKGLTNRKLGEQFGQEGTVLTEQYLPAHSHTLTASSTATGLSNTPATGWTLGAPSWTNTSPTFTTPVNMYTGSSPADPVQSAPSSTDGQEKFDTMSPALCLNFIICYDGYFPSRE